VRQLGLQVQTGLHTGECGIGDDVAGIAVHIGARVCTGEVMVSSTVKDLFAGSGIQFAPFAGNAFERVQSMIRLYVAQ
jgi:hypothetical protein